MQRAFVSCSMEWNGMEGKLKARERSSHVAVHAYIPRTSTTNQVRNQESSAVHSGVECRVLISLDYSRCRSSGDIFTVV
jgi:hypothetical protein